MIRKIAYGALVSGALALPVAFGAPAWAGGQCVFTITGLTVAESVGTASLTVSYSQIGGGECPSGTTVSYSTADGTAVSTGDYTARSNVQLAFGAVGTTQAATVPIANDAINEATETLTVSLSTPSGGTQLGSPSSATLTINDDDPAPTTTVPTTTTTSTSTTTTTTIPAPGITVSPNTASQGGMTNVVVTGAGPGSQGTLFLLSEPVQLTTAVADAGGVIRVAVVIPRGTTPGSHSIEARIVDAGGLARTVSAPITVTAVAVLAATGGSDGAQAGLIGGVLGVCGLALIVEARRRRGRVAP